MWKKKHLKNQKEEQYVRSKFRYLLTFICFILWPFLSLASSSFYFNTDLLTAQQQNYELRLADAKSTLLNELRVDPDNSATHYLLHFNVFLKAFISEKPADYTEYLKIRDKALFHYDLLPDSIAYKKYAQADAYFYSAALKAKFEEFYGAARDANKANTLIEENHESFPNFLPNNKIRGIVKVYLSTVPDNYAWVVKLLGIDSDISEGLGLLKELSYANPSSLEEKWISREASYLYSFSLMHVAHQPYKAWMETLRSSQDYTTNLMSAYFRSAIASRLSKNELIIAVLESRPTSPDYEKFYFLEYQLGSAKLNKLDSTAITHFIIFDKKYEGKNYIKSNLQKMSWYYTLFGNEAKSEYIKSRIIKEGNTVNEEDKQALLFARKKKVHSILLKSRVLYDGGYIDRANALLADLKLKDLANNELKAEYCYRRARIMEKQKNMPAAIKFYEACSLFALESTEYYGAYACIYLGEYYAKEKDTIAAKKFFKRALSYNENKEYKGSIEQRAKAGLKQL